MKPKKHRKESSYRKRGTGSIVKFRHCPNLYVKWTIAGKRFQLNSATDDRDKAEKLLKRLISKSVRLPMSSRMASWLGIQPVTRAATGSVYKLGACTSNFFYLQWVIDGIEFRVNSLTGDRGEAERLLNGLIAQRATLPLSSGLARSIGFQIDKPCGNPKCKNLLPCESRTGLPYAKRRFCSNACMQGFNYRRTHPIGAKICPQCSSEFRPTLTTKRKFCSRKCCKRFQHEKAQRLIEVGRSGRAELVNAEQNILSVRKQLEAAIAERDQLLRKPIGRPKNKEVRRRVRELRAQTPPVSWGRLKLKLDREFGKKRSQSTYRDYAENPL